MAKKKIIPGGSKITPKADTRTAERMAPADDTFIFHVAELAWSQGLAPNSILKAVNKNGANFSIMQVKRALSKAFRRGILTLNAPLEFTCAEELKKAGDWKARNYTVVKDDVFSDGMDPVCLAAAEQIVEIIPNLLKTRQEVVIGNAGGRSVSRTVHYLQAIAPVLDKQDRSRLVFIALNSAGTRREFDLSSNFLAVRLAEIFDGKHIAVLDLDRAADEDYDKRVLDIDLMICGAGGRNSMLKTHAADQGVDLPQAMIGDLAFIPLIHGGRPLRNADLDRALMKLLPYPGFEELQRIALDVKKEVLVLFAGESKLEIADAILTAGLATRCVMGVSLARQLLAAAEKRRVNSPGTRLLRL